MARTVFMMQFSEDGTVCNVISPEENGVCKFVGVPEEDSKMIFDKIQNLFLKGEQ